MRNFAIVLVVGIIAAVFDLTYHPKPDPETERVAAIETAKKAELVEQVDRASDELEKATDKLYEEFPKTNPDNNYDPPFDESDRP